MQMLCSRLCHDLVGSVGAINAAVELIDEEAGGAVDPDIVNLLSNSAREASRKLEFFRAAFGLGGSQASLTKFGQIRELVESLTAGGKVSFKWMGDTRSALPNIAAKLVYMMALLSAEALPRGGIVTIHVQPLSEGLGLACAAEGAGAALRNAVVATLEGNIHIEDLSAREVHAHYAKILAEKAGSKIEQGAGESLINFAVLVPSSSLT
jgi:histidine phosphotransferase ChpT